MAHVAHITHTTVIYYKGIGNKGITNKIRVLRHSSDL